MKQILQNLSNGKTSIIDSPSPKCQKGSLLIASRNSLISSGTERMLVGFGKANMLDKARQQPEKVKMVLDKVRTDGLFPTIDAVRSKLDQPLPLGYCNAGIVLKSGVDGYSKGDRVISNGHHSEVVRVAKNLCAKIPDEVDDESAAFTVLASVGLQGIRLIKPTLGEAIVVIGLGLVGLLTIQMLRANGCRVLGIDSDSSRCKLAKEFGAEVVDLSKKEDPISIAKIFSRDRGVDAVIIAAVSQSDEIMHQAAEMCRKRARIVLVGVVGLSLRRDDFFEKEISFQVSASYGPGRYDPLYEEKGQDYPLGFVRWTEQRNFEAVLDMMAKGSLDIKPLITHRFKIDDAIEAYALLDDSSALGMLLSYPQKKESDLLSNSVKLSSLNNLNYLSTDSVVGFVGAGNYASRTLIPAFKKAGAQLDTVVTSGGINGMHHGKKAGFRVSATDLEVLWGNEEINTAVIATRHNDHADQVIAALNSGKHVFVEKPLALKIDELNEIDKVYRKANDVKINSILLMVGFNRRFAPHVVKMKSLLLTKREPKVVIMTINAGDIPHDHWTQDMEVGGGRIIGEGCHFIDLMRFLVGHNITSHQSMILDDSVSQVTADKVTINLSFADGSIGTIHYLANGGKIFPKERIEIFCANSVLQLDNYRLLRGYNWTGFKKMRLLKQDKGQNACAKAFVDSIHQGLSTPIHYDEIIETSRVSIEIAESLHKK